MSKAHGGGERPPPSGEQIVKTGPAFFSLSATNWWLRSPRNNANNVANVNTDGTVNNNNRTNTNGVRPDLPRLPLQERRQRK